MVPKATATCISDVILHFQPMRDNYFAALFQMRMCETPRFRSTKPQLYQMYLKYKGSTSNLNCENAPTKSYSGQFEVILGSTECLGIEQIKQTEPLDRGGPKTL